MYEEVLNVQQKVKQLYDLDKELIQKYVDKFEIIHEKMKNRIQAEFLLENSDNLQTIVYANEYFGG